MAASAYPSRWEADVLLRDGRPVHLRPITPGDAQALRLFHSRLSARTVYYRFFSAKPELTDADVAYFTGVDHVTRVALVALDRDAIIGVGRFDSLGDGTAEVAFLIRDDMQGRGLGSVLLEHLAEAAREVGVHRFVAEVLPENSRMLATFREAGYVLAQHREEDVMAVGFDIEPTAASRAVMAAREHRAEARSMERMLRPRVVAVVGASRREGGLGRAVLAHLATGGFTGRLVAVHHEATEVGGVPCVAALRDVGEPIDLVVVVVPAAGVHAVLEDAAEAGAHGLVVVSGGFGDSGPQGLTLQAELVATVHRTGMRLVGPNALGIVNTDPAIRLNASLVPTMPAAGRVAFFCQSGALGSSILERFAQRGLGISSFVSAGNRADVSGNDLLQYWEEDTATDAILLHLETIGNARKFARLVHRVSQVKPVVMIRTGGTLAQHPLGHAVARTELSQQAVDQVLADCGLVVVDSVNRLIDIGRVLAHQPLPATGSVAVVSNSDALAVLAENAIVARGLSLAARPATFGRADAADAFAAAVRDRAHDPEVGTVLAIFVPPVEDDADVATQQRLVACEDCGSEDHATLVAVMTRMPAQRPAGSVPVFADVEDAVQTIADAHGIWRWRQADKQRAATPDEAWPGEPPELPTGDEELSGEAAARIVSACGRTRVIVDLEGSGVAGCEIRLLDDPLFGAVVAVGVDDPVADLLADRSFRLAPVSVAGAAEMLASLGAVSVLIRESNEAVGMLHQLAVAVSDVSHLHLRAPGIREAVVRHGVARRSGDVAVGEISLTISREAAATDPAARRM